MSEPKPTLSILIPTYSRAGLLEVLLHAVLAEPEVRAGLVPVLVSDNCSPDGAGPAVVRRLQAELPEADLRLNVMARNLGAEPNYTWLFENAPETDYGWLIGDDDAPVPGAVGAVLELLAETRPTLLHLPHTFERDGRVYAASPCPPSTEILKGSRELCLRYTRWPTFISSCVVERTAMIEAIRELPTMHSFAPYLWFTAAARERRVTVAGRPLMIGGTEASWSDIRVRILTDDVISMFDASMHRILDEREFCVVLDGFYAGRDCLECWDEQPLEKLAAAVTRFPHSHQLRQFLWILARAQGRNDVLGALDDAAKTSGAALTAEDLIVQGEVCFEAGDLAGAQQRFADAAAAHPTRASAWNNLGVALHAQGRADASDAFALAIELDPDDVDALLNQAMFQLEHGRHTEAAHSARQVLALQPADAEAQRVLATATGA